MTVARSYLAACAATLALALGACAEEKVELKFLSEGAMRKMGGYRPQKLDLKPEKPAALKKAPELSAPSFGTLKLGAKESPTEVLVVVDEPEGKPSKLYVDANGDGELTDDEGATSWEAMTSPARGGGKALTTYFGGATVKLKYDGRTTLSAHLGMYRFDKDDPNRKALKDSLFYFSDYAYEGTIALGDASYKALLVDTMASGDFRGSDESEGSGVQLMIDVNNSGKFDSRGESYDIRKPFNIKGVTYEIAEMTAAGDTFKIVKSDKKVEEVLPPPDLSLGKNALKFDAKTTDGHDVKFPSTYAGKLVLLDFWATWCGPCIGELPNLTAAYDKYHDKGFDVLGISLDQEGMKDKLAQFTKEKKMPWPQVYDGKYWQAEIAQQYGIDSIPRAFLVDGDTGEIVATVESLRGEKLAKTVEEALAKKKESAKK